MKMNSKTLTTVGLTVSIILAALGQFFLPQGATGLLWLVLLVLLTHVFHFMRELVINHFRLNPDMTRVDELQKKHEELEKQLVSLKASIKWQKVQ